MFGKKKEDEKEEYFGDCPLLERENCFSTCAWFIESKKQCAIKTIAQKGEIK